MCIRLIRDVGNRGRCGFYVKKFVEVVETRIVCWRGQTHVGVMRTAAGREVTTRLIRARKHVSTPRTDRELSVPLDTVGTALLVQV